jgi:biotin--protein ligase
VVGAIIEDDEKRIKFLRSLLEKLGLQVPETDVPPRLSTIHLTSIHSPDIAHLVDRLQAITTISDSTTKIIGENDTFILHNGPLSSFSPAELADALSLEETEDLNKVPKTLQYHTTTTDLPSTPFFSHSLFYNALSTYRSSSRSSPSQFGTFMLYGETITSTNTMLDKSVS